MFSKDLNKNISKQDFFDYAYSRYSKMVRFYVYSYLKDNEKSNDIVQDVFLAFWEKIDTLDSSRDVFPYILVMAKYRCLNHLRREKYHQEFSDQTKLSVMDISIIALEQTEDYISFNEVNTRINAAVESMPPKVRETFIYSRYKLLKNKETAEKLMISEKTVEYRISCAYKILKKALKGYISLLYLLIPFNNM